MVRTTKNHGQNPVIIVFAKKNHNELNAIDE